ncbi:MAG: ABC transporter substrate-binding protein [Oscillospiraceae bacterium]|nr:ABC transporter substrate-binding protein [Oscillospiraceae bacterium]
MGGRRVLIRIFAVFGALALILLAGCSTIPQDASSGVPDATRPSSAPIVPRELRLALGWASKAGYNPYLTGSRINLDLAPLLFEGLTVMDDRMTARPQMAQSVRNSGTELTAVLKSGLVFSDGLPVTNADVIASFNKAKSSANYSALLVNVKSVREEAGALLFTLQHPDIHAGACLTFPVLPKDYVGSEEPRGGGMYIIENFQLRQNPYHPVKAANPFIGLAEAPDRDALLRGLENGTVGYFFNDLAGGDIPHITTRGAASVPLPYLIFLGVNSRRAPFSDSRLRQAVNLSLGRADIVRDAFPGYADPALTPYPPAFAAAEKLGGIAAAADPGAAGDLLIAAGYNARKQKDPELKNLAKPLTADLVVNSGNPLLTAAANQIRSQLAAAGIAVNVVPLSFDEYKSRLSSGNFDLYLGGIRLSANLSLYPLLPSGAVSYGVAAGNPAVDAYKQYLADELTLEGFAEEFWQALPYIPVCWQRGMAVYNRSLSGIAPTGFNPYYGIEGWRVASSE